MGGLLNPSQSTVLPSVRVVNFTLHDSTLCHAAYASAVYNSSPALRHPDDAHVTCACARCRKTSWSVGGCCNHAACYVHAVVFCFIPRAVGSCYQHHRCEHTCYLCQSIAADLLSHPCRCFHACAGQLNILLPIKAFFQIFIIHARQLILPTNRHGEMRLPNRSTQKRFTMVCGRLGAHNLTALYELV